MKNKQRGTAIWTMALTLVGVFLLTAVLWYMQLT